MKDLRNTVTLMGRVGQDPKIVEFQNGNRIANFPLATNYTYKNSKGEKVEDTQWHNLSVRNGLVKVVEDYVKTGKELLVEGRLVTRSWEDKEGNKRYTTEVQVNELLLIGGKK